MPPLTLSIKSAKPFHVLFKIRYYRIIDQYIAITITWNTLHQFIFLLFLILMPSYAVCYQLHGMCYCCGKSQLPYLNLPSPVFDEPHLD